MECVCLRGGAGERRNHGGKEGKIFQVSEA